MKKWTKVIYSLGVLVMVAPNFVIAGTVLAETVDSSSAETATSSIVETQPSKEEQAAEDAAKTAEAKAVMEQQKQANDAKLAEAQHQAEMQSQAPETSATTETEGEAQQGKEQNENLVSEEQLNQLKTKLPEGSEVIFENGKLTIKLPAGVEPEVGQQAVMEMGLQDVAGLEIEVTAKLANPEVKFKAPASGQTAESYSSEFSFDYGYQIAIADLNYLQSDDGAGSYATATIANLLDGKADTDLPLGNWSKNYEGIILISPDNSTKTKSAMEDTSKTKEGLDAFYQNKIFWTNGIPAGWFGYREEIREGSKNVILGITDVNFAKTGNLNFKLNRAQILAGYKAATDDFCKEFRGYINQISSRAQKVTYNSANPKKIDVDNRQIIADSTAYDPSVASVSKNNALLKIMGNMTKDVTTQMVPQDVWAYTTKDPLIPVSTEVQAAPPDKLTNKGAQVVPLVTRARYHILQWINTILPQLQNLLVRQTLEDPRAIGGSDGVLLPENIEKALKLGPGFYDAIYGLPIRSIIDSSIVNADPANPNAQNPKGIYPSLRDPIKDILVTHGQLGIKKEMEVALSGGTKPADYTRQVSGSNGAQSTLVARDSGYFLAETYTAPLRAQAFKDATAQSPRTSDKLFADLEADSSIYKNPNTLFYKNGAQNAYYTEAQGAKRFNTPEAKPAKEMLYNYYLEEVKAIKQAIADYQADPLTDPRTKEQEIRNKYQLPANYYAATTYDEYKADQDGTKPLNRTGKTVKDYYDTRLWLYLATEPVVRQGIADATESAHKLFDKKTADGKDSFLTLDEIINKINSDEFKMTDEKTPANLLSDPTLKAALVTKASEANTKVGNTDLAATSSVLADFAKSAYKYGFNGELPKLTAAYKQSIVEFESQSDANTVQMYGYPYGFYGGFTLDEDKETSGPFKRETLGNKKIIFDQTSVFNPTNPQDTAVPAKDYRGYAFLDGLARVSEDRSMRVQFKFREVDFAGKVVENSELGQPEDPTKQSSLGANKDWARVFALDKSGNLNVALPFSSIDGYEPISNKVTNSFGQNVYTDSIGDINSTYIKETPTEVLAKVTKYLNSTGQSGQVPEQLTDPTGLYHPNLYKFGGEINIDFVKYTVPKLTDPLIAEQDKDGNVVITGNVDIPKSQVAIAHNGKNYGPVTTDEDGHFTFTIKNTDNPDASKMVDLTPSYKYPARTDATVGDKKSIKIIVDKPTKLSFNKITAETDPLELKKTGEGYVGINPANVTAYWFDGDADDNLKFKVFKEGQTDPIKTITKAEATNGQFSLGLTKDNITEGSNKFIVKAYKVVDTTEIEQASILTYTYTAKLGALSFNVETGKKDNTLMWTNRLLQPGAHLYERDAGNTLKLTVSDSRLVKDRKQWSISVGTEGSNGTDYRFVWKDKQSDDQTNIPVATDITKNLTAWKPTDSDQPVSSNEDTAVYSKTWEKDAGVLLYSDNTIPVGEYQTGGAKDSQTIVWTLKDSLDAE